MAQITYRANLSAANFPFLARFHGQSIIVGNKDQNFVREIDSQKDVDKDRGIPQAYYMENVMPTGQGFQSIGYIEKIAGLAGTADFARNYVLRDANENFAYFDPAGGKNYIYDGAAGLWQPHNSINAAGKLCTVSYLSGETYIFYESIGCFRYDFATKTIIAVPLTGITASLLNGMCAANGFLIAWDSFTVYRSSLVAPTDFTPDFTVGAGSSRVQDVRGAIKACLSIPGGFIVYTKVNAVAATFNINQQEPFVYGIVRGSGGISDIKHVSYRDNAGDHYAWTNSGMQKINKTGATPIFPELTDFLISKLYESFDKTNWLLTEEVLTIPVKVAVNVVASRFLVISYGKTFPYSYALVYDIAFARWGKFKFEHVDVFEFITPKINGLVPWKLLYNNGWASLQSTSWASLLGGLEEPATAKDVLGFMGQDGTITTADFSLTAGGDGGLLLCGRYQYIRQQRLMIDDVIIENVEILATDIDIKILSTLDGKTVYYKDWPIYAVPPTGQVRQFQTEANGKNHTLAIKGTFHIVSLELVFHLEGHA